MKEPEENKKLKTILIIAFLDIIVVVLAVCIILKVKEPSEKEHVKETVVYYPFEEETKDEQRRKELTDMGNADTIESILSNELQNYTSAVSRNYEEFKNGNSGIITSIASDNEILEYRTIDEIVSAGYQGKVNGEDSLEGISWEYGVYQSMEKLIMQNGDEVTVPTKQEGMKFYIQITGSYEEGYHVMVKAADTYPFD